MKKLLLLLLSACATGPIYTAPSSPKEIMSGRACISLPQNHFGLVNAPDWSRNPVDGMTKMDCGAASYYISSSEESSPLIWTSSLNGANLYTLHGIIDLLSGSVQACMSPMGRDCKPKLYEVTDKPIRIVLTAEQVNPLKAEGPVQIKVIAAVDKTIVGQIGTAESIN